MRRHTRNIIIFVLVTVVCGFAGNAINRLYGAEKPMESLGVLVWLISPMLAGLLLRALGGDGWSNFGFGLKIKNGWRWYLAALLIPLLLSLSLFILSGFSGLADPSAFFSNWRGTFLPLVAVSFSGNILKNFFEEFAWRGYLAERLNQSRPNALWNALITGLVWASWHIPYYLYFLDAAILRSQTALSVPILIGMSFLLLPFQALLYNELRLVSGSVWPAWLLHTVANALSFALLTGGFVQVSNRFLHVLTTPGTEGILYALLSGLIGWTLHHWREKRDGSST
jgi:membrane protease YdiL (CAAX protease family)